MAFRLKNLSIRDTIKRGIIEWIKSENIQPGDRISSQTQLAKIFNTTEVTIHKALREMVDEGILTRTKGRGTYFNSFGQPKSKRTICFVLPGENLEKPEVNPEYWAHVQTIMRAFIGATHGEWSFTTKGVSPRSNYNSVSDELEQFSAIFFHFSKEPRELIKLMIRRKHVPVFCQGLPDNELKCTTLDHDRIGGVRMAISYMLACGYRKIAFLGTDAFWGRMDYEGYKAALAEKNIELNEKLVFFTEIPREAAYKGALELLNLKKEKFDAVFVDSDSRALTVIDAFRSRGVRVPEDVGVMGYDGIDYAINNPPFLTTVKIPYEKLIGMALTEIENNPEAKSSPHRHISILGEINPGATILKKS